jgi:hypothetical protein
MTATPDYALLALAGYPRDKANAGQPPQGWIKYDATTEPKSDFAASTFYNESTGEVVISFAGTDLLPDWRHWSETSADALNDIAAANGAYSEQVWQAIRYYADMRARLTPALGRE